MSIIAYQSFLQAIRACYDSIRIISALGGTQTRRRQSRFTRAKCVPALRKADDTLRSSQAVPHPSTNRALRRLTSEVGRDPVYSTWYGRRRTLGPIASQKEIFLYELPLCVQVFVSCSSRKTACAQSNTRSIRASSLFKR